MGPALDDYVPRALDPERAPAFGVAGDESRRRSGWDDGAVRFTPR